MNLSIHEDVIQLIEEVSSTLDKELISLTKFQKKIQSLIDSIGNVDINENHTWDKELSSLDVSLSDYSIRILTELYNDPKGTLLVVESHDGFSIVLTNNSFDDNNNPRERAKLEKALEELLQNNYISPRGTAGTVFGITSEGYEFIDSMK